MINEGPSTVSHHLADEFVMGEYLASVIQKFKTAMNHWRFMVLLGLIFSAGAGIYAIVIPTRYVAKVNFVIEENKQNAGGLFSALAGQIGMDISAVSGGAGLLAGDNVLQLLKSTYLIKKSNYYLHILLTRLARLLGITHSNMGCLIKSELY